MIRLLDMEQFEKIKFPGFVCSCGCEELMRPKKDHRRAMCYDCHAVYQMPVEEKKVEGGE